MATISTHNGSAVRREHNRRNPKVVSKEPHIKPNGEFEVWKDQPHREAYHQLFDEAVKNYNAKQKRDDRLIDDYYQSVVEDKRKHPVYEMIVGIYEREDELLDDDVKRQILKEFVDGWEQRNPNLHVCGAYYHADEGGQPHVHIDYIPVATGYQRGMEVQSALVKALEGQGFYKNGKATAQILWEKRENEHLESLCRAKGIEVEHPRLEGIKHLDTASYKAKKELDSTLEHTQDLMAINDDLKAEIGKAEEKMAKLQNRAKKGLRGAREEILAEARSEAERIVAEAEQRLTEAEKKKQSAERILAEAEKEKQSVEQRRTEFEAIASQTAMDLDELSSKLIRKQEQIDRRKERIDSEVLEKLRQELTRHQNVMELSQQSRKYSQLYDKLIAKGEYYECDYEKHIERG